MALFQAGLTLAPTSGLTSECKWGKEKKNPLLN